MNVSYEQQNAFRDQNHPVSPHQFPLHSWYRMVSPFRRFVFLDFQLVCKSASSRVNGKSRLCIRDVLSRGKETLLLTRLEGPMLLHRNDSDRWWWPRPMLLMMMMMMTSAKGSSDSRYRNRGYQILETRWWVLGIRRFHFLIVK